MNFNPYQAPTSAYDTGYTNYGSQGAAVSDRTVAALRKTRPWVLFIAVFTFVMAGIAVLGGIGVLIEQDSLEGLAVLFAAVLVLLPAVAMIRFASAINRLLHGGGVAELEKSMEAQASIWQIAGIYTMLYLGGIILLVIIGVSAVSRF